MVIPTETAPDAAQPSRRSTERRRSRPGPSLVMAALCAAVAGSAGVAGCASGTKDNTLPTDGPTMAEIYRQHMAGVRQLDAPSPLDLRPQHQPDAPSGPRFTPHSATGEIDQRFQRLPNPDLLMYVVPHLAADGRYPVPGYSTVFPMYETVEYALPGETSWPRFHQPPSTPSGPAR